MTPKVSLLLCCFATLAAVAPADASTSSEKEEVVGIHELKRNNFSVKFTNWGATIVSLVLPDKNGNLGDVVLGYDSVDEYKNDSTYFGAIVGRVANRIKGAQFVLNGTRYKLDANEKGNMLHGGHRGFSDVVWKVKAHRNGGHSPHITFTYHSTDGEEGFPGDLKVAVTYALVGKYKLSVTMKAKAINKATPVNLAQHSYFNLGGHNSGDVLSDKIQIFASNITPVDDELIPTGVIAPVKDTPYDFLKLRTIGDSIKLLPNGYDINYVIDEGTRRKLKPAAVVRSVKSGRVLKLFTSAPGLQFYTGNYIKDVKGKGGFVYQAHAGLCLETQGFPDSVNHPNFPSQIINPGETYKHYMLYEFSAIEA